MQDSEFDSNFTDRTLGRMTPRFYAVPRTELDRLNEKNYECHSVEEAIRSTDEQNEGKSTDVAARRFAAVLLIDPVERLELFAIVVNGERRRYYLDKAEADRHCEAYNSIVHATEIELHAAIETVHAWTSAPRSGVSVGEVFKSSAPDEEQQAASPATTTHATPNGKSPNPSRSKRD
jgi:hypothetical protein